MKRFFIALMLCFISVTCFSQEIKVISDTFPTYQGVVTTKIPAKDLYTKAKLWIAENFKSANDVIQLDSPETGSIICKGIYVQNAGTLTEFRGHFTFKIEAKDNRFRYTITVTDIRSGTKDVSSYQYFIDHFEGRYARKFDEEFKAVLKQWILKIANATTNNSTDDDW